MKRLRGKVWKFEDHVDTDQIIPAERLTSDNNDRLGSYLFEKVRPGMASKVSEGDIIVAGRNFGCGSSREHAPRALLQAGIVAVVAESFARIFYRNAINVGLLPVECSIQADEGDVLSIDVAKGKIINVTKGTENEFPPFPPFVQELMDKGGLMAKIKEEKRCTK
jgi:3-isopropylmalate dehydratase small subunit